MKNKESTKKSSKKEKEQELNVNSSVCNKNKCLVVPDTIVKEEEEKIDNTDNKEYEDKEKKDKKITKDEIIKKFHEILNFVLQEINLQKEKEIKTNDLKFLRTLLKQLKGLQMDTSKVLKQKNINRKPNNKSGFLQPVKISNEMSKFANWNNDELHSRVDVTTYICDYIKNNKLQNPDNRKEIIPDDKLKNLLKYDDKKDKKLTYPTLQTYLSPHFIKN